jgi:Na+/H+-dicarboxylate symporter
MKVIEWAMILAPYAVFGLIANVTIQMGFETLAGVGAYMMSVLLGLFCMFLVYVLIVALIAKRNIFDFLKAIRNAQIFAFSTSSSAATMPFTLKAAEERLDIDPKVSRFVIPLGATINMDGTALYQAAAALFLCSIFGVDLTTGQIVFLMLTTVGASIGTPATPGVGIIVLATILSGIGVPPEGIGIILGVDRILDMCRTTLNVTGDLVATSVMARFNR